MVSHHLDGFLRATAAGLLHPAASHEVRLVSPDPVPSCHPKVSLATWTRFPAARFIPFKGFPSSAAVPHHCGRCPLIVGCQSPRSCLGLDAKSKPAGSGAPRCSFTRFARPAEAEPATCLLRREDSETRTERRPKPLLGRDLLRRVGLPSTRFDRSRGECLTSRRGAWRCEDSCSLVMTVRAAEAALLDIPRLAMNHRSGLWLRPRCVTC